MYELKQMGKNTYMIDAPANIGIYRLNETDVCIIDTGMNDHMGERILNLLNLKGWRLKLILNTHHHADHVGGNSYLQEKTGCEIYASEVNAMIMKNPLLNTILVYGGEPYSNLCSPLMISKPCDCKILTEGILPAGFAVKKANGHSLEMLIYKTPDDIWFLGDSVIGTNLLEQSELCYLLQVEKYLESLDEIEGLSGSYFVPAHGKVVPEIKILVDKNRIAVQNVQERILELCSNKVSFEELAGKVLDSYQLTCDTRQYTLFTSTIRSYLSFLEKKKKVSVTVENNQIYWTPFIRQE